MADKKFLSLNGLSNFLDNLKILFATKSAVDTALSNKADATHIHDERYYTELEVDEIISEHTHSYDDLRNKPFYEGTDYSSILAGNELTTNFYDWSGGVYGAAVTDAPKAFTQDVSHKVIWDGIEYTLTSTFSGNNEAGNPITSLGAPYGNYSTYPFGIDSYKNASGTYEFSIHTNSTNVTHTIDILELGSSFVTLDERFIPDSIARTSYVDDTIDNLSTTYETKTDAASKLTESKAYTDQKVASLVNGAPETLNTLDELAAALDDNADILDVLNDAITSKADINHTHTGTGDYSTFVGADTSASGNQSTVIGQGANITNTNVTVLGQGVTATSDNVTALGQASIASGANAVAIGQASNASGSHSISIGQTSEASGDYSIAIGQSTIAPSDYSTIIGQYASGGISTTVVGQGASTEKDYSVIIGAGASATGDCATVIGQGASAAGAKAIAIGIGATAAGNSAVVLGSDVTASGDYSFATGYDNEATGNYSHVEGVSNKATDYAAHAEGDRTEASSTGAHAEGQSTVASGLQAHAEGRGSVASGSGAHAEGMGTTASGTGSHSEGTGTRAEGMYSHAEGASTVAKGYQTHAEGSGTIASGSDQHVQGRYNVEIPYQYAHIVGNGSSDSARSNMHTLDWQGNAWYSGDVLVGGTGMTSGASRVTTEADHNWNLIYDSGYITSAVNSFANLNVSGYKNLMIAVKCVNNGNPGTKAGAVIFKATNGTTYQFPVWGNMFSATNMHCGGMGEFKFVDGHIVCPGANRVLSNTAFLSDTEGGTAANMIGQGGGIMKCTNVISTVSVSSQDQNSTYYFGAGSRLIIWGWNA